MNHRKLIVSTQKEEFISIQKVKIQEFDSVGLVGHPISSDNGLIAQNLLLKSEFYYPLHVAMDAAYSCLKYGVIVTT